MRTIISTFLTCLAFNSFAFAGIQSNCDLESQVRSEIRLISSSRTIPLQKTEPVSLKTFFPTRFGNYNPVGEFSDRGIVASQSYSTQNGKEATLIFGDTRTDASGSAELSAGAFVFSNCTDADQDKEIIQISRPDAKTIVMGVFSKILNQYQGHVVVNARFFIMVTVANANDFRELVRTLPLEKMGGL